MARATFFPAVTVIEQGDGSLIAEVDWTASITHAEVDGTEVDVESEDARRISERLDAFLQTRPAFRGFVIDPSPVITTGTPKEGVT